MNKSPCFPFYPSDFFGDIKVRMMTGEEQAFYMLLLANIWEYDTQFSIPSDPKIISTLLKISEEKWTEISARILECLEQKNGRFLSRRLMKEKDKQDNYRKQQSIKGVKSAEKRSTTVEPRLNHGATGGATGSQPEVNSSISISISKPKNQNKAQSRPFVLPEWIPTEVWSDYLATRAKKRAAKTDHALWLVVAELEKIKRTHGHDPIEVLKKSIRSGWTDVYPLKDGNGNGRPQARQESRRSPYVTCARCGEEYLETDAIEIGGKKVCPKCPESRAAATKMAKEGYSAIMRKIGDRIQDEETPPFDTVGRQP